MKVRELIRQLQIKDPDAMVVIDGYECGYDAVVLVGHVRIKQTVFRKDFDGQFTDGDGFNAVYLPRKG